MTPFLQQIASLFYNKHRGRLARLAFVFPNRRAGLFFKKYLAEQTDKPLFAPQILTINDLFQSLSDKQPADRIGTLFRLYELYRKRSKEAESFDSFLYWGEMLLNDFNDVDKQLADARMLFTNVTDLRAIEQDFEFLSPEQVAAIRTFWSSFHPVSDSTNQKQFLAVWEILYDLYSQLRQQLAAEGVGYEGMLQREVIERLRSDESCSLPYQQIVFVGMNALTVVERELMKELRRRDIADFYWDTASAKATDPANRASHFILSNQKEFPSHYELEQEPLPDPTVEVIGVPSGVGQAKQVYALLQEWMKAGTSDDDRALKTAIILPDKQLLMPLLHSIPTEIERINVTMGYPLAGTPIATLMNQVTALQKNCRVTQEELSFYYRDVLPILNHRYVRLAAGDLALQLVREITEHNRIFVDHRELPESGLAGLIFQRVEGVDQFMSYLLDILQEINRTIRQETAEEELSSTDNIQEIAIEQEFIYHYFSSVSRIREVIRELTMEMKIETCYQLIKKTTDGVAIPFQGEPLSGLQIMGVLETRSLDFDRVIILSFNEGTFPSRQGDSSFIPYNLRRGFGLPTYEHQDSIWAYNFYRLIHRASHVTLLYDTRTGGLQTGEVSRYVHQLKYHYRLPLQEKNVVYRVSSSQHHQIAIAKDSAVMQRLAEFREGGNRALSASAINTYLDCPLKFYFSVVENIQEEEEVSETIESNVFGSILHRVMEVIYEPLRNRMISIDVLDSIRKDHRGMTQRITEAFAELFFKSERVRPLTGQNYLIGEMIRKYATQILLRDNRLIPFTYLESEMKIASLFGLSDGNSIQLKGFIDRLDQVGDTVRIIDYKSGAGSTAFSSVERLFDKEDNDRAKAVMQVFMYAWMYGRLQESKNRKVVPGIYFVRNLFSDDFNPAIIHKIDSRNRQEVTDFLYYADQFEEHLRLCLDELFNESIPFTQTTTGKACIWCPFKDICGK